MDEEPDAAAILPDVVDEIDGDEAEMPEWSGYLLAAWQSLRNDRQFFDMGGCSGMFYRSISAYAADHGLTGDLFPEFEMFLRIMDDEYVAFSGEKAKEAAEAAKREQSA